MALDMLEPKQGPTESSHPSLPPPPVLGRGGWLVVDWPLLLLLPTTPKRQTNPRIPVHKVWYMNSSMRSFIESSSIKWYCVVATYRIFCGKEGYQEHVSVQVTRDFVVVEKVAVSRLEIAFPGTGESFKHLVWIRFWLQCCLCVYGQSYGVILLPERRCFSRQQLWLLPRKSFSWRPPARSLEAWGRIQIESSQH